MLILEAEPSHSHSHSHSHEHGGHSHSHGPHPPQAVRANDQSMDKLRSTIKQFVRDWSEEVIPLFQFHWASTDNDEG